MVNDKPIDLEEYLAEQKRFLRRFELHALRNQNVDKLPREASLADWDRALGDFIVADMLGGER